MENSVKFLNNMVSMYLSGKKTVEKLLFNTYENVVAKGT